MLEMRENRRSMQMTVFDEFVYKSEGICTAIAWQSFWGFRTDRLTWCKEIHDGRRTAEIRNDSGTLIEWADDGSENS